MQWFRHYHGLLSDPKFGSIARRTGQPRERVVFVWLSILESASEAKDRGIVATDIDAIADTLNCDDEPIHAIWVEFETRGMLVDGRVAAWEERNPSSDSNADRQKRYRERKRNGDVTVTPRNAVESDTDTDIDDGGVRRARDFAGQDLTDPNALLEAVCAIVGTSGATNPNWAVSMECANWLRSGYDPHDDILPTVEATMKRKDDGPPGSLKYFTKAIARARADRLESLNPVILERPKNARSDHRQGGSPHDGIRTGIAAAVARRMEAGVPGSGVG